MILARPPVAVPAAAAQFASSVDLVEVYATVADSRGELITDLTRDNFVVDEDGERQSVTTFAAGAFPLALAIAVDRSFSMSRTRLEGAADAVRALLRELRPEDQVMLVGIGSETEVLAPLSGDRRAALDALGRLTPWGTTPLYDAAVAAMDAIEAARGRRALILLSDGNDRYSATTGQTVVDRARTREVLVYPVALGRERPTLFAELAAVTGGRSFHTTDMRTLPTTLNTIARELRFQYLLGYVPTRAPSTHEEWRSIHVSVDRPGARVRARDGYLAR